MGGLILSPFTDSSDKPTRLDRSPDFSDQVGVSIRPEKAFILGYSRCLLLLPRCGSGTVTRRPTAGGGGRRAFLTQEARLRFPQECYQVLSRCGWRERAGPGLCRLFREALSQARPHSADRSPALPQV